MHGSVKGIGVALGVGLGHHLVEPRGFHDGETLQAQRSEKLLEGGAGRHRLVGDQRELPLHARVDHHVAAGDRGDGAGHGFDVGVGEIQRHGLVGLHAALRRGNREHGRAGAQQQGAGSDGVQGSPQAVRRQEIHGRFNPR
ncbi:hypothetical protein SDC9_102716 [bioreactor metagenome]|uniref:Uncharacterized protein n=1 Tax=bioreactor metagenome TaxID=1076179 RepID=A0A645AT23_9ZZZZ